jgi:lysophospholipase L1-like esterase
MGDSITEQGSSTPLGYVNLVITGLAANGIKAEAIPAGHSGHKSNDMLIRLNDEVINRKPDWMTLSCGVNDVWHGANGVPLDQYKINITQMVDKAQAANIKVMLLTSTMITENQADENNQKLVAYNDFLKALAAERKLPLADLNADMQVALAATPHQGNLLTHDGVHMNTAGNTMMAQGVLKAFGLNAAQLAKAREAWLDMPGAMPLGFGATVSLRQYEQLHALAARQNLTLDEMLRAEYAKMVDALIKQK